MIIQIILLMFDYLERRQHIIIMLVVMSFFLPCYSKVHQAIWPDNKIPDRISCQVTTILSEQKEHELKGNEHQTAYIEWYDKPNMPNGACIVFISGEDYNSSCDFSLIELWHKKFSELGFQCVNLIYRTHRPKGAMFYQAAWEDAQRSIRVIRNEAEKRNFDSERIGVISMSVGSHLALLLATNSQSKIYKAVDKIDSIPCHINYAIVNSPVYVTTDSETGTVSWLQGYGSGVKLSKCFYFDSKTCPISLHHGGLDEHSPNGSTLIYRQLRRMNIPAELHLYPDMYHGAYGLDRGVEFLRQIGIMGKVGTEENIMERYKSDDDRKVVIRQNIWPEGKIPNKQEHQLVPYIEWHFPKEIKTKSIQIIYSGGSYVNNNPDEFEVAPVRRYLNKLGMVVVTLRYRTPRPKGLPKHISAWEDLQRTIRLVRFKAIDYGLDPNQIGIMGSSAGGHLTLMGVTSSLHKSYIPIDEIDMIPCNVQWGICIYPAYVLTDGIDNPNTNKGNGDYADIVSDFSFDINTAPMLLIHGDADVYSSMGSVKVWEKMRCIGIQSELHTLALRKHCFQRNASPGTGSYTWLERISDFLRKQKKL